MIGGVCYAEGNTNTDLECQICNSDKNSKGWSHRVSLMNFNQQSNNKSNIFSDIMMTRAYNFLIIGWVLFN